MGKKRIALAITVAVAAAYSIVVVPHATAAAPEREQRNGSIFISNDKGFTPENGVRSGSGTPSDPYVISGWDVFEIHIKDTDKDVIITNNTVEFLTLNWNGNNVEVTNNDVGDLRVNENVKRTGGPTSGSITNNTFDVVGQLRHFDGVFAHNTVGAAEQGMDIPFFSNERAVNFDGFNGAHFFDNTIYGYVEVRLHGHHHSSGYDKDSHNHGMTHDDSDHSDHPMENMVDHTVRFHQASVHNNKIFASGPYALIYTDSNHAGNDRTASSEQNEELNQPHTHYTKVQLTDNELVGAGLYVDIFNAKDDRHTGTNRGAMTIARNDITMHYGDDQLPFEVYDGITVWNAQDVDLRIVGNSVRYDGSEDPLSVDNRWQKASGIYLKTLDKSDVWILRNFVKDTFFGVRASNMTETVSWRVADLETAGVSEPVSYDQSVKNRPEKDR